MIMIYLYFIIFYLYFYIFIYSYYIIVMSDSDSNKSNELPKSILQEKTDNKIKKKINPQVAKIRSENMKKALAKKKENYEAKNKLKVIEYNISDLINNNDLSSDEEIIEPKKKDKKIKELSPQKKIIEPELINEHQKSFNNNKLLMDNLMDNIMSNINNINKKVEKLYIMKKNKPPKQTQVFTKNNNGSSDDLLNAIRNKMLNN